MIYIMIVDDEPISADGATIYLENNGDPEWEIRTCYSPREVLRSLHNRIDVLIADVSMPEMNGVELARQVVARWPLTKIIFLTAYSDIQRAQEAVRMPESVDYLLKDEDPGQLMASVQLAISRIEREKATLSVLPLVFDAIRKLSEYSDLTLVHWAQLLDSGVDALGLVDVNGKPRPAYAAFEIYQRIPARRLKVDAPAGVQMMASADADRVSILLWGAESETELALDWVNLPFHEGTVAVHLLDKNFFDAYGGHLVPNQEMPLTSEDLMLTLLPDTVAYIEINRSCVELHADEPPCHEVVRSHYFFENRDKNRIAWYDERTGKTVLGMGNNENGLAVYASEINAKQDVFRVKAITEALVNPQAYRAVRVDFATAVGYAKAVVYANQPDAVYPALPFGTGRPADAMRLWPQVSLDISLAQDAPEGWNGRLLVTFVLKDAGPDSWLELKLR